jgi:hypothetical protein
MFQLVGFGGCLRGMAGSIGRNLDKGSNLRPDSQATAALFPAEDEVIV